MELQINGFSANVEHMGEGPLVIALHGGPGLDHTYLRPWLDPLAQSFTLAYLDQRGSGGSPVPAGAMDDVSMATWASDVDALRGKLGFEKCIVLGHSFGSFIALEHALRYGNTLRGLVLCEVAPVIDYPQVIGANAKERAGSDEALFGRVMGSFGRPATDDADMERTWRDILPVYFKQYDAKVAESMNAKMRFRAAPFNQGAGRCLPTFNVSARLGEIRVPTLIMNGRYDWILPVAEGAERVHAGIPSSTLYVFEHSGHFPFVEEPEAFMTTLKGWLAKL